MSGWGDTCQFSIGPDEDGPCTLLSACLTFNESCIYYPHLRWSWSSDVLIGTDRALIPARIHLLLELLPPRLTGSLWLG